VFNFHEYEAEYELETQDSDCSPQSIKVLAITKSHENPLSDCSIRSGSGTDILWLGSMGFITTGAAHTRGQKMTEPRSKRS
jgi:hypothetical protein